MLRFETKQQYEAALSAISDCLQNAIEQTGIHPKQDSLKYIALPAANYIYLE